MAQSNLITFTNGHVLNLDRIVSTEWHQPKARRGKPAPARELVITTDVCIVDEDGQSGPWLLFVADDDGGASELLKIIQAYARPALPAVTIEDDDGAVTFRAGAVEVVALDEPGATPEVFGPWAGSVEIGRLLAAARAVEAIISDPRYHRTPAPAYATAAD